MIIPIIKVYANPFTVPVPIIINTIAAINVVILPSTMADVAFWKPIFMEDCTVFPVAISSRTLAKMITFASTAIPIPNIIPAIPGKVNVISKRYKVAITRVVYPTNARDAATPGIRYMIIMKIITSNNPIAAAFKLDEIASLPKDAPTIEDSNSCNSKDNEPIRIFAAMLSASAKVSIPVICACPPVIASFTSGLLITSPSYTIGN